MERRPEEVAEVKSRRGTTLERHFQITKHSHRLYLLRHKILSADLQRLQTYKAPREGPLQSPDPEGPTTDPFRGSEPAAARAPTGSNRRARHSPAANRRRAAHLPRAPADRLCSRRRRCWGSGLGEERTPPVRMVLESVARIVKVQLPAYLKRLPVPESITGFARLTGNPHLQPLPILGRSPRRRRGGVGGGVGGGVEGWVGV